MSRRGLRRGGQQQWLAEAVGLKSASLLAALQFLTLSSPCCMRGLEVGQRRDRLAFPALVSCTGILWGRGEVGAESQDVALGSERMNFFLVSLNAVKKVPPSPDQVGPG